LTLFQLFKDIWSFRFVLQVSIKIIRLVKKLENLSVKLKHVKHIYYDRLKFKLWQNWILMTARKFSSNGISCFSWKSKSITRRDCGNMFIIMCNINNKCILSMFIHTLKYEHFEHIHTVLYVLYRQFYGKSILGTYGS